MTDQVARTTRELSEDMKMAVVRHLVNFVDSGKLRHGAINDAARRFELHRETVSKVWRDFNHGDIRSMKAGRVGRKAKFSKEEIIEIVQEVPEEQRSTMRDISEATGLSVGMIHRNLKTGAIERQSTRLKPLLSDEHKLERITFCKSYVRREAPDTIALLAGQEFEFFDMWDAVHLDEKWFNADIDRRKVYLVPGEEPKRRACKFKRFLPKVMFLAVVAHPRFNIEGECEFDGKIGLWPIVKYAPAIRNSRNRAAGTIEAKSINIDAVVYLDFVVNKVIPAIKRKFPSSNKRVVLQHDNATPHSSVTTASLSRVSTDGWKFVVKCQPAQSPDLNVLDLGFFASIQSLQYKVVSQTVEDVIQVTLLAFQVLCPQKLSDVFLTLQAVMRLVLEHNGDNHFKLPHLNKDALRRDGCIPTNLMCSLALLEQADSTLQQFATQGSP
ncbi:Aste57867_11065 [Aphanomyces stellatus]|uniref:Aste57867_11065 protein n=1 Tax=Aphanomyces stellatus TaxID=120398 RepID=A0A485KSH5_9STRA|nr:hypothetical protein As57867_011023 [Aphanomyces stellatus]VFT87933.1 Aste57867_11065 [Aphanomyces stellatus]